MYRWEPRDAEIVMATYVAQRLEREASREDIQDALQQKAHELFMQCDKDGKGVITKRDMQNLQGELSLSPDQLEAVFDSLDLDTNGYLTLQEFTNGFGQYCFVAKILCVWKCVIFFNFMFTSDLLCKRPFHAGLGMRPPPENTTVVCLLQHPLRIPKSIPVPSSLLLLFFSKSPLGSIFSCGHQVSI